MREAMSIDYANINYGKIYDSALRLLHQLNSEKTYSTIIEEAKKLVGGKHGTIHLMENNTLKRVYASSPLMYKVTPRIKGFAMQAYKTNMPFLVSSEELLKIHPEFKKLNVGSDLIVPLQYSDKPLGVLAIFSYEETPFTEKELALLRLFSPLASLAIINMRLYSQMKNSLDERDLFISMAAHELKTPLTTIFIYSQLLLRKEPRSKYSETQLKMKLSDEIRRLTNLVNELLQVNQIKIGSLKFIFRKCDLCSIVDGAIAAFENIHTEYKINYRNEIKKNLCFVNGDFDKLFQVVTNLLNNAAKFSPKNSTIDLVLKYEDSQYILSITDRGPGIRKKDLPHIFERFYKGDSQNKDGLGLGLFLVKNIIDQHKGNVSVLSKINQGTTFSINLPMYDHGET